MEGADLLRAAKPLSPSSRVLSEGLLSGDFRSCFRGRGVEFESTRPYVEGEDARIIDWRVSARTGSPYAREYREERELTVLLVADASASMGSGSAPGGAYWTAALALTELALACERNGNRLGLLCFSLGALRCLPPRQGRGRAQAVADALADCEPRTRLGGEGTELGAALLAANRLLRQRALVFVASDFRASSWVEPLARLCLRHDCVCARVVDPLDSRFPSLGFLELEDPESGDRLPFHSGLRRARESWASDSADRASSFRGACARARASALELPAGEDPGAAMARFFSNQRRAAR
jgi:uncharacterized protein (DUF58 family)